MSTLTHLTNLLQAIANDDCSSDNQSRLFSHQEIKELGDLLLLINSNSKVFNFGKKHNLLFNFYASIISENAISPIARSTIAGSLINVINSQPISEDANNNYQQVKNLMSIVE